MLGMLGAFPLPLTLMSAPARWKRTGVARGGREPKVTAVRAENSLWSVLPEHFTVLSVLCFLYFSSVVMNHPFLFS